MVQLAVPLKPIYEPSVFPQLYCSIVPWYCNRGIWKLDSEVANILVSFLFTVGKFDNMLLPGKLTTPSPGEGEATTPEPTERKKRGKSPFRWVWVWQWSKGGVGGRNTYLNAVKGGRGSIIHSWEVWETPSIFGSIHHILLLSTMGFYSFFFFVPSWTASIESCTSQ